MRSYHTEKSSKSWSLATRKLKPRSLVKVAYSAGPTEGSIIAIHSTVHPRTVRKLAEQAAAKGLTLIDAEVGGGERGAIAKSLCYMVGGDKAAFEKCRPIFATSGANIFTSALSALEPLPSSLTEVGGHTGVKNIGIVAVSTEGAALCYRRVIRSRRLRPRRSSFQTMSVSPGSSFFKQRRRAGRLAVAPDRPSSLNTVWHPAFFNQ